MSYSYAEPLGLVFRVLGFKIKLPGGLGISYGRDTEATHLFLYRA